MVGITLVNGPWAIRLPDGGRTGPPRLAPERRTGPDRRQAVRIGLT